MAASFLFVFNDGGGNVPPQLAIARLLVARGHRVRLLTESPAQAFSERIETAGCRVVPYQLDSGAPSPPPPRGLAVGWTPVALGMTGLAHRRHTKSPGLARRVYAEARREPADVVVADDMLPGALIGAEAAGAPAVSLLHTIYMRPAPGLPPYPSDFRPARGPLDHLRDALFAWAVARVFRRDVLPALNLARRDLGLPPVRTYQEQYDRAARILVMTSPAFDFPARVLPPNVRYVGMPFDDQGPPPAWSSPWTAGDRRPLVLLGASTTPQGRDQAEPMQRALDALAGLPVRGLATLGPHLSPDSVRPPVNVVVRTFVPHAAVLPEARAMVSHCGHASVMAALAHGVPLVCMPGDRRAPSSHLGKDQPAIATRVVARGAGLRVPPDATTDQLRAATGRVLSEPTFRTAAERLRAQMATEHGAQRAVDEIEAVVAPQAPASKYPTRPVAVSAV